MALIIEVKVTPSSGRRCWLLDKSGRLKCYLKNAPEKGRANMELLEFIADSLKIPIRSISLIAGATGRTKKIKIDTPLTYEQFLERIGLEKAVQQKIIF